MKRFDLRHLHDDFYDRMAEIINEELKEREVGIFLFEIRNDFSHVQRSANFVRSLGHELMNSLKFAEPDWTIVVKKMDEDTRKSRIKQIAAARHAEEQAASYIPQEAKEESPVHESGKAE